MGRLYTVSFENVTISAAQDLFQIKGAAGKMLRIRRVWFGATSTTLPTAQMLRLRMRFLGATVTDGTGGTTPTPQRVDAGDAAASFTALANNATTKASSSGTTNVIWQMGYHDFVPVKVDVPGWCPVGPDESFVFELLSTVSGTIAFSGTVEVEEIGG